jgi:hypothetical protein
MRLLQAMAYLIEQPAVALLPFLSLLFLYFLSGRRFILLVALLWACYVPYEFGMKLRLLCSGECNIRIDLLLIYPALALLSVLAVAVAVRTISRNRRPSGIHRT